MPSYFDDIVNRPYRTEEEARRDIRHHELTMRWHKEGWRTCENCHGRAKGCHECDGQGEYKLPFFDWLEEQEELEAVEAVVTPIPVSGDVNNG